ncbi:enhancer of split malpha protein [Episyrphus balteatus]|uniref:enhancer of split malpha protein n=1 Tax=Episyrphus balteatus TaxID=286459 RepID=UPI002486B561|nr:enhancer of split malpha protein [Episyrphus balteatus]
MSFISREYKFETSTMFNERKRFSAIRNLRKVLKPLFRVIKKKQYLKKSVGEIQQNDCNTSLEDMRKDPSALVANDDNAANEALEQRILAEVQNCGDNAAILVHQGGRRHVVPVHREQKFIPVHFARTNNGTFFWTSVEREQQQSFQQEHHHQSHLDRWVQA